MYCAKCGKKNADDRLFCGFCGSPLNTPDEAAPERDEERRLYGRPEAEVAPDDGAVSPRSRRARHAKAGETAGENAAPASGVETEARGKQEAPRRDEGRYGRPGTGEQEAPHEAEGRYDRPEAGEQEAPHEAEGRYGRPGTGEQEAPREDGGRYGRPEAGGQEAPRRDEGRYGRPGTGEQETPRRDEGRYGRTETGARRDRRTEEATTDPLAKPLLDKPVELRVKHPPRLARTDAPVAPRAAAGLRRANTVVPPRQIDPDNMFFEDEDEAEDDLADFVSEYFDDYRYEEPEKQNFFLRHIRGVVCLTLLAIVTLIVGYWLLYGSGQRVLGQLYISSDPQTYIELGDEANAAGGYETAGAYYLKALSLDPTDRNCAINAANAYIRAGNSGGAAEALEYLIAIDPNDLAPYVTLKQLYPDAASRPQRLTQLLQQGYERTGEASLLD